MTDQFYDICMPSLGADMTEGKLVEWLVKVGDRVNKGDIIAVIETQKGAIDMEAYQSGRVAEILVQPIADLPVGTPLARLATEGAIAEADTALSVSGAEEVAAVKAEPALTKPSIVPSGARILASPAVRQRVQAQQLDLSGIRGTGPAGAILLRDLEAVYERSLEPEKTDTTGAPAETDGMRVAIARAMEKSNREIPHYHLTLEVDISRAQQWLQQYNADKEAEQRMLLLALVLKAVAKNLAKFPQLNGYYLDGQYRPCQAVHIGNVISLRGGGMMVPAIHDVGQLSLHQVMAALRDSSLRSRSGHLRSSELTDATVTVTSMGERGSDQVLGVIYPPQVAIIGVGRPRRAPVLQNDQVVIGEILTLSLSADHRVSDGIVGAKFLNAVAKNLQKPEVL